MQSRRVYVSGDCSTCESRGTVPIPEDEREPGGYESKLCPHCGGQSNSALFEEIRKQRGAAARVVQDAQRALRERRKRERTNRQKARRRR